MGKISYSQFAKWDKCPYTWKLDYVDKLSTFKGNIYTLFGTAVAPPCAKSPKSDIITCIGSFTL